MAVRLVIFSAFALAVALWDVGVHLRGRQVTWRSSVHLMFGFALACVVLP